MRDYQPTDLVITKRLAANEEPRFPAVPSLTTTLWARTYPPISAFFIFPDQ